MKLAKPTTMCIVLFGAALFFPPAGALSPPGCLFAEYDGHVLRMPGRQIFYNDNGIPNGAIEWASIQLAGYAPCAIIADLLACIRDIQTCTSDELALALSSSLTYDPAAPVVMLDTSTPPLDLPSILALSDRPDAQVMTQHEVLVTFNTKGIRD